MDRIKNYSNKVIKNPFFSGSLLMVIGSNFANVFAYLYHIVFGRILTVAEYGNLASFLSMLGLLGMIIGFVGIVITKFIASAKEEEIPDMLRWFYSRIFYMSIVVCFFIFIFASKISESLKIDISLVLLLIPTYLLTNMVFVTKSAIQGMLDFKLIVIGTNTNLALRIVFGLLFVYLGYSSLGAASGVFFATLVAFFIYWNSVKKLNIFSSNKKFNFSSKILKYSFPIFIATFATSTILNIDLLLVKYYFSPEVAGQYAAVSVLGKIIFYATAPISSVMFPMLSKRYSNGRSVLSIFGLSVFLSLLSGISITIGFFVIPQLAIIPLYGAKYLQIAEFIGYYAIFVTLYSLSNLIVSLYQSIERPHIGMIFVLTAISEVFLISRFHDSVIEIIQNLIIVMAATLVALIVYMSYDFNKIKIKNDEK